MTPRTVAGFQKQVVKDNSKARRCAPWGNPLPFWTSLCRQGLCVPDLQTQRMFSGRGRISAALRETAGGGLLQSPGDPEGWPPGLGVI